MRYVAFDLPAGTKLEGRAKVDELQKLAEKATKFTDSLAGMPLDQAAASSGLSVRSTPAFDRAGTLPAVTQVGADAEKQIKDILDIYERAQKVGAKPSAEQFYLQTSIIPQRDEQDALQPPQQGGQPGAGGMPGQPGAGAGAIAMMPFRPSCRAPKASAPLAPRL